MPQTLSTEIKEKKCKLCQNTFVRHSNATLCLSCVEERKKLSYIKNSTVFCAKCNKKTIRSDIRAADRASYVCKDCKVIEREITCANCSNKCIAKSSVTIYCRECQSERNKNSARKALDKYKTFACSGCGKELHYTIAKAKRTDFLCRDCKHPKAVRECYFCGKPILLNSCRIKTTKKSFHSECGGMTTLAAKQLGISKQGIHSLIYNEIEKNTVGLITRKQALENILKRRGFAALPEPAMEVKT